MPKSINLGQGGIVDHVTSGLTAGPFDDVVASEASLKRFLHGLPGVDQVGAEAGRRARHPLDQDDGQGVGARPARSA